MRDEDFQRTTDMHICERGGLPIYSSCAQPKKPTNEILLTEIVSSHTIVHPRTMMIHPTDTTIADTAMMTHGWFECLTLSTHGVTVLHEPLAFTGNGCQGNTSGIRQGCLGMTCQRHATQDIIQHAQCAGNASCNGQQCDSDGRVEHEEPYQS